MDFAITKETITTNENVYSNSVQQPIDCDVTLPEYCPDILRILKCQLIPRANSYSLNGDRLCIDGSALIRVLYIDEAEAAVHSYEQICQFNKTVEIADASANVIVDIECETEYVNCRAMNQRKININAAVNIKIKINAITEKQILSSASGNGIQIRTETIESATIKGFAQKTITLDETLELSRSDYAVSQLIRYSGDVSLSDVKIITNKLLIKGELNIKMLYTADEKSKKIELLSHSLPISQIIDVEGIDDTDKCKVKLKLTALDLSLRSDSNGELRLADVIAKISVTAVSTQNINLQIIKEAYSIKCALETEKQNMTFTSLGESINDVFLLRESLDVASVGTNEIIDMWINSVTSSSSIDSKRLKIFGSISISMLIIDASHQVAYLERQVEFENTYDLNGTYSVTKCDVNIGVNAIDYTSNGNDRVDVKIELRADIDIYRIINKGVIVRMAADEISSTPPSSCALTIYFCDENESIWDIAKKYNTTVEAIMKENELEGETITKSCMLMIPAI